MFLCTSGCGESGKWLPHQLTTLNARYTIENILDHESWSFDHENDVVYEYELMRDTLQLSHYSFARSTTSEEKKLITHLLVNLKLGNLKRQVTEDGSAFVFLEKWQEQFIFFPNIEYWLDDQNNPIMISKIADANRDEIIIGLSLQKINNAHIEHCLYDRYSESENYLTQLTKYSTRDIENLLTQLRGWRSVTAKQ
jgi:uncharacterized protein YprB with RNaseH-like and TPR domain